MWVILIRNIASLPALVLQVGSGSLVGAKITKFGFGICRRGRSCRSWRGTKASLTVFYRLLLLFLILWIVLRHRRGGCCMFSYRVSFSELPDFISPLDASRAKYDCVWLYRLGSDHSNMGRSFIGRVIYFFPAQKNCSFLLTPTHASVSIATSSFRLLFVFFSPLRGRVTKLFI